MMMGALGLAVALAVTPASEPRRFLLAIGQKAGDAQDPTLVYAEADARSSNPAEETSARLCVQFEQLLGPEPFRLLSIRELCQALGASEQTLRASCRRVLGMGPGRYQRLRRRRAPVVSWTM